MRLKEKPAVKFDILNGICTLDGKIMFFSSFANLMVIIIIDQRFLQFISITTIFVGKLYENKQIPEKKKMENVKRT